MKKNNKFNVLMIIVLGMVMFGLVESYYIKKSDIGSSNIHTLINNMFKTKRESSKQVTEKSKADKEIKTSEETKQAKAAVILSRAYTTIQSKEIDILSAQLYLNQQFLINDKTGLPLTERDSSVIFSYNTAAKSLNKNILEVNELIRSYNKSTSEHSKEDWFLKTNLPSQLTEMNYIYLVDNNESSNSTEYLS